MEMPAELIRLAMSLSASAKLSVGLKIIQPGKVASRQPQLLAMSETTIWLKSLPSRFSRCALSPQHLPEMYWPSGRPHTKVALPQASRKGDSC